MSKQRACKLGNAEVIEKKGKQDGNLYRSHRLGAKLIESWWKQGWIALRKNCGGRTGG